MSTLCEKSTQMSSHVEEICQRVAKNLIAYRLVVVVNFLNQIEMNHCQIRIVRIDKFTQFYVFENSRIDVIFTKKLMHQMLNFLRDIENVFVDFLNVVRFIYEIEFIEKFFNDFDSFFSFVEKFENDMKK